MTICHPPYKGSLDELDMTDLGLLVTATDVHRRSLVRQFQRHVSEDKKDSLLDDIDRLGRIGDLLKRVELDQLDEQQGE